MNMSEAHVGFIFAQPDVAWKIPDKDETDDPLVVMLPIRLTAVIAMLPNSPLVWSHAPYPV